MTTRKAATPTDMQRFLAASIGLPGTPERIFYQMRMTQSAYLRLADRKQGLGWQIHSMRADKIPALLEAADVLQVGPLSVVEEYDRPKFNGDSLIDSVGTADGYSAYLAVIPNKQAGIMIVTNRVVSHHELVSEGREILFNAMHLIQDDG